MSLSMIGRSSALYGKAGLLGFLGGSLVFMLLPLAETSSLQRQVLILLALQGLGVMIALLLARRRGWRKRFQFDLTPRAGRGSPRRKLTIEQFLDR